MIDIDSIHGGPFDCNIYLLRKGDTALLVDSGTGFSAEGVIRKVRRRLGKLKLDGILLTHEHIDHSGGASTLREEFDCDIFASDGTADILERADRDLTGCSLFGVDLKPVKDIRRLGDGFDKGEIEMEVRKAPGHAPGQICLIETESRALFCGDLLFCDGGVGRWDLPGGDFELHRESIRRALTWEVKSLHPGHGRSEWDKPMEQMETSYAMVRNL